MPGMLENDSTTSCHSKNINAENGNSPKIQCKMGNGDNETTDININPKKRSGSPFEDEEVKKIKIDTSRNPITLQDVEKETSNTDTIAKDKNGNIGKEDEVNSNGDLKECKDNSNDDSLYNGNCIEKLHNPNNNNHDDNKNGLQVLNGISKQNGSNIDEVNNPDTEQCDICGQFLNNSDIIFYQGHPQNAVEEFIALTNEKLVLASGDEGDITERPQTNITGFSIFDEQGHLCPIDGGLIENDVRIYMSGYLKSICSDDSEIDEESVPVKDVGPIIEWYIHGFDGGKKNCITLSTEFGEYNLLNPSAEYTPLMNNLYEKIWLSKVVVEYLEEFHYLQPAYEDLLEVIREATIPELGDKQMTEDMLHKHAQFVCDQVVSLEVEEDDDPLITLPCMREIIKLMGIKFGKRKGHTKKIQFKKVDKKTWTKATTTPLVRKTFESFFTDQLDKTNHDLVLRRKRCGICEACQMPDCGECNACRAMAKFGGHGRTKKACVRRLCPNMAVEQAEDSDPDDEDEYQEMADKKQDKIEDMVPVKLTGLNSRNLKWIGDVIKADAAKVYYEKVEIDGAELQIGDYVMVETSQPNIPALVARVVYMWKETINPKMGYFHGEVFIRSSDTVLGEVGDPREVYLGDRCCHGAPLSSILRKAYVEKRETPKDWFKLGGKEVEDETFDDDGKTYFYQKYYDRFTARFEDVPEDPVCPNELRKHRFCPSCERKTKKDSLSIPKVSGKLTDKSDVIKDPSMTEWASVSWQGHEYKKGCGVFLKPGTFKFENSFHAESEDRPRLEKVDEDVFPEYYRKSENYTRGSNADTGEPFDVGHVAAVASRAPGPLVPPQDVLLLVRALRRPEQAGARFPHHEDLNRVCWSDDVRVVPFAAVAGPCQLTYERNAPEPAHEWLERDPARFYFRSALDAAGREVDVPPHAALVGRRERGKDKGKGKGKSSRPAAPEAAPPRPLRALDVFAGCGGLSAGLAAAGAADVRWAVENVDAAAHAYALNHRACAVFREDCNALLAAALRGEAERAGLRLPRPGEVELLCGGPPCQGFSGMNRFNSREYSNFKNSLVASYLSYCDYYRPKYFILENVRNFVAFKRGMVLKLTLRALLAMGYQCTFGVLQAGQYGVPQTRRRLVVLAAAPGLRLPRYPAPTHVFSRRACALSTTVDGKRFAGVARWEDSAPRRTCTIRDAMSDLPRVANGAARLEMEYGSMPASHFQRALRPRDGGGVLRDHVVKNLAPLIQARMARVPATPGADWRDLPNVSVTLSDGTKCKVLQYRYDDSRNGRSSTGARRGVCACASGRACDPRDKQENTLIPWCLPHTANRHNNWAGLYGRVSWDGYFSTTVTDPEPMGKQGRVLHPEQNRVVSVRECARSQGFPDSYIFAGTIQDKHRQIGNAVPPPLGAALGREIIKAMTLSSGFTQ